jgi:cytochrome c oxidase subunit II
MSRMRLDESDMTPRRRARVHAGVVWCAATCALAGCAGEPGIFSDATDAAARVTRLTWFMIGLAAVVYAVVVAIMLIAMQRNRHAPPDAVDLSEPGNGWVIVGGLVMPAVVLGVVLVLALVAMGADRNDRPVVTIAVTGHQWWWEVRYRFPDLPDQFATANEIHIPARAPVRLVLTTKDVIHSFWVPQLQGKIDLIPGETNEIRLFAKRTGTYRGACSEFCGMEHAKMGIVVVVEDSATFRQWARQQLADAAWPTDSLALEGKQLFETGPCSLCHTVRATPAGGGVAPDLTHVGSRSTIAAGALPNTLGNLEAWIANAQSIKPGVLMPTITMFSGRQLRAVATYVAGLK